MRSFYFALLAALVWGIAPIVEKSGLRNAEPLSGVLLRSLGVIIGAILISLFNINILKSALRSDLKSVVFLSIGGILASIFGQMFFYNALKYGEASKMVPIAATYPLVSFLLALIFFRESFTIPKAIGMLFILMGVFLLK